MRMTIVEPIDGIISIILIAGTGLYDRSLQVRYLCIVMPIILFYFYIRILCLMQKIC